MGWITWDYKCEECGHIETHMIQRGEEEDYVYCVEDGCNGQCFRMYGGHPRTEKSSASLVDGTRRFDKIKLQRSLRKEKDKARQRGDRETEKIIDTELIKTRRR